jgi:acetolactate synthase I/II/III large subunit
MIKLSDYVMSFLIKQGVSHVFTFPGGGCMHLLDSLGRSEKLQYICNLNEQALSIAVEAYGQYTNHLGVGLVTTGPGGTNAITGVAAAYVDSTPCLFVSGQAKRSDLARHYGVRQYGYQEINISFIVKPITKYAVTVMEPKNIRYHLEKAVYLATNGRKGPVWLDIPLDVQAAMIDENTLRGFQPPEMKIDDKTINKSVEEFFNCMNDSRRPCILAGNGIYLSGAKQQFFELARKLKIPVLLTWKATDFFDEQDPLYFGRPGAIGQRGANFIQQNCDLIIVMGARLDLGQIAYNHANFAPKAKKIMIDIDPMEIEKIKANIDLKIVSDVKIFINKALEQGEKVLPVDRQDWLMYCLKVKKQYPVMQEEYWNQKDYANPYALLSLLSDLLTKDDLIIPGSSGSCSEITMQSFRIKSGQRLFNNEGLGSMGFGLPASIGSCIASGNRRTICINSDGGFQLNIQELETVKRLQLPIKIFILNNQGFGSITATQRNYFDGFYVASEAGSGLTLPDICKISGAYGIKNYRIHNNEELKKIVPEVLSSEGPVICDVMIHPEQPTMPRVKSEKLPDGSMVSKPMEDMWPYLDRNEFEENMRW